MHFDCLNLTYIVGCHITFDEDKDVIVPNCVITQKHSECSNMLFVWYHICSLGGTTASCPLTAQLAAL